MGARRRHVGAGGHHPGASTAKPGLLSPLQGGDKQRQNPVQQQGTHEGAAPGDTVGERGFQPRQLAAQPGFNIHGGARREAFDLVCFAILLELNSHLPADTCHMSPQSVPRSIAAEPPADIQPRRRHAPPPSPRHPAPSLGAPGGAQPGPFLLGDPKFRPLMR